jgi:hypothetical protein
MMIGDYAHFPFMVGAETGGFPRMTTGLQEEEVLESNTYFYDMEGRMLGSGEGILPVSLYKGMKVTLHGDPTLYKVVDWQYHHGYSDERAGLSIVLTASREEP